MNMKPLMTSKQLRSLWTKRNNSSKSMSGCLSILDKNKTEDETNCLLDSNFRVEIVENLLNFGHHIS